MVIKNCIICGKEFGTNRQTSICCSKECTKENKKNLRKIYYNENKDDYYIIHKRNKQGRKEVNREYLRSLNLKCKYCGIDDYDIFDFHHVNSNEKEEKLATLISYSHERFKKELDKCICLCANCHQKLHRNEERKLYNKNVSKTIIKRRKYREWLISLNFSCKHCGINDFDVIEFHHINPETKNYTICEMIRKGMKKETILEELDKCIPLCRNCHRKLHIKNVGNEMPV